SSIKGNPQAAQAVSDTCKAPTSPYRPNVTRVAHHISPQLEQRCHPFSSTGRVVGGTSRYSVTLVILSTPRSGAAATGRRGTLRRVSGDGLISSKGSCSSATSPADQQVRRRVRAPRPPPQLPTSATSAKNPPPPHPTP